MKRVGRAITLKIDLRGFIALFILVPVSIPIFGRLLGWVVAKIPALAGAVASSRRKPLMASFPASRLI
jgi:hypothetical protein